MLLLIDNYDSFTFNLYQQISMLAVPYGWKVEVVRNDRLAVEKLVSTPPRAVIVSPGPGRPEDTAGCLELLPRIMGRVPLLGVCLGHQLLASLSGASIIPARSILHGKRSRITHEGTGIFKGCPAEIEVARYHSLAIDEKTLPKEIRVAARSEDGEIMGIESTARRFWGVQFHPESFLTESGDRMIRNFLDLCR